MANRDPAGEKASVREAGRHGDAVPPVSLDQTFDEDGLYSVRSALVAHATALGAEEGDLDRVVLVVSELATNAVRHGGGSGRLRLWRRGDRIVCEVTDRGPGIPDPDVGQRLVEPSAVGGRGLWICRQLADTMSIAAGRPGAIVTVAVVLAAATG